MPLKAKGQIEAKGAGRSDFRTPVESIVPATASGGNAQNADSRNGRGPSVLRTTPTKERMRR